MKSIIAIALMLVVASGTAWAFGSTSPQSQRTCAYKMNQCEPYTACTPVGVTVNVASQTPEFKACAKDYVDACSVTKFDGNGVRCTTVDGEKAWGFLWK